MSRWQPGECKTRYARLKRAGACVRCGKRRTHPGYVKCAVCLLKGLLYRREYDGCAPHVEGGPGRKPAVEVE